MVRQSNIKIARGHTYSTPPILVSIVKSQLQPKYHFCDCELHTKGTVDLDIGNAWQRLSEVHLGNLTMSCGALMFEGVKCLDLASVWGSMFYPQSIRMYEVMQKFHSSFHGHDTYPKNARSALSLATPRMQTRLSTHHQISHAIYKLPFLTLTALWVFIFVLSLRHLPICGEDIPFFAFFSLGLTENEVLYHIGSCSGCYGGTRSDHCCAGYYARY